jgi:hypothetical protein
MSRCGIPFTKAHDIIAVRGYFKIGTMQLLHAPSALTESFISRNEVLSNSVLHLSPI